VPDGRFGGGGQVMVETFLAGARAIGRSPRATTSGYVPAIDALNQLAAGRRLRDRARAARSLWVVAAAASYGFAAPSAQRPYACWIGTGLDDEWRSRVAGLPATRRVLQALNAPLLLRLERRVLADAALVYAISPASQAALARVVERDDVGILPIPLDLARFTPQPDEDWLAGLERPTVVFVGRGDDPRKNVRLLLEAWPAVRAAVPAARVLLVGRPPSGLLPNGVDVRGEVADVAEHLREGTLFVLPSLQEGFAIVAAEALACGVPVVSTPCGGPEAMLGESGGGRVLEDFDPRRLAEAIVELLENSVTLLEMRRRGRAYVSEQHSDDVFRRKLAVAFASLDACAG
jgi:glycosyltransferase involved in cell wall biosynthesis